MGGPKESIATQGPCVSREKSRSRAEVKKTYFKFFFLLTEDLGRDWPIKSDRLLIGC